MSDRPQIRVDIEALRAVAVVSVVLFHARVPGFSGGFCGVDIFFVISGFLITGLLVRELEQSRTIDLLAFWARRAWRLLPNALLVIAATLVGTFFLVPVADQALVGGDVISALLYVSNYHFAGRALDYFDHAQATSPVLHFWSLSVEEQFYVGVPLLLLATAALVGSPGRRRPLLLFACMLALSLGAAVFWTYKSHPKAFFDTESRIWELSAGAIVMLCAPGLATLGRAVRAGMAAAGLAGIVYAIVFFEEGMSSPALFVLLPVVSTGLLIGSDLGRASILGRLCSLPPVQWVGRRSYSLYLWHWPFLILAAPQLPETLATTLALLAAITVTSALAFACIEDPLRRHGIARRKPRRSLALLMCSSAAVGVVAFLLTKPAWIHGTDSTAVVARILAAKGDEPQLNAGGCRTQRTESDQSCRYGATGSARRVVLFGDSYARHLFDGMDAGARAAGWSLEVWTRLDCPPLELATRDHLRGVTDTACEQWRAAAVASLLKSPPDLVVISSWLGVANIFANARVGGHADAAGARRIWSTAFEKFLTRLREGGLNVAVVRSPPRGRFTSLQSCMTGGNGDECARPRHDAFNLDRIDLDTASAVPGVRTVDLSDRFCGPSACYSVRQGVIVYRDRTHHLTATFSRSLAPDLEAMLRAAGK